MTSPTRIHLVRHGQVHNPEHVLYGRLPGFGLSELGRAMAQATAAHLSGLPITHLRCSPLQRARETMAPIAAAFSDLEVVIDERVIEADNLFAGRPVNRRTLARPRTLWRVRNPMRPSWGEPYASIAARMRAAIDDAATAAGDGGQAVIVAHELPIWISRLAAEGRHLAWNAPRRECALASVTTLSLLHGAIVGVDYVSPAAHLQVRP